MVRPFRAVTIVVILAAGAARSGAQPSVEAASSQAELEEAKGLNDLVEKLLGEGKYPEALAPAERALAIREKVLGPNHPDVAESLNNLAATCYFRGAYAKAESLFLRALVICEKALGLNHPSIAPKVNNLAMLYQAQGA